MHFSNPCSRAKGFVLSPLPELGTMGSKWGGARVTGSSTSSRICSVPVMAEWRPRSVTLDRSMLNYADACVLPWVHSTLFPVFPFVLVVKLSTARAG
jgi:hypothetical protein